MAAGEGEGAAAAEDEEEEEEIGQQAVEQMLEFLRLLCEGHHLPNQQVLLRQPLNKISVNCPDVTCRFLNGGVRQLGKGSDGSKHIGGIMASIDLCTEAIQGLCADNQEFIACSTPLLDRCNRIAVLAALLDPLVVATPRRPVADCDAGRAPALVPWPALLVPGVAACR